MLALIIGAPVVIMLALAYATCRLALWPGYERYARRLRPVTYWPGFALSGYQQGIRLMRLERAGQHDAPAIAGTLAQDDHERL